jgi:predicted dehydrogenase
MIGVGGVGAMHLRCLGDLESEGRVQLIAVADPTVEKLPAEKAHLDSQGVRWHLDYRSMLEKESELEAVVIITPVPFHFEMTKACIERGVFVYLEKPPVPLIQQLDELIALDGQERVHVAFQWISSEPIQHMKELVISGRLGRIRSIRVTASWARAADYYSRAAWAGKMIACGQPVFDGPATNALAHMIHNIMFLAGKTHETFAEPTMIEGELYRARPIESYDVVCLRGEFSSGITFAAGFAHACEESVGIQLEIKGEAGWATLSRDGAHFESSAGEREFSTDYHASFGRSTSDFVDFATGRRDRAVTRLRDARGYVLATNGALVSSGGVRGIDPMYVRTFNEGPKLGYALDSIAERNESLLRDGALYSESGAPWARRGAVVDLQKLTFLDLEAYR